MFDISPKFLNKTCTYLIHRKNANSTYWYHQLIDTGHYCYEGWYGRATWWQYSQIDFFAQLTPNIAELQDSNIWTPWHLISSQCVLQVHIHRLAPLKCSQYDIDIFLMIQYLNNILTNLHASQGTNVVKLALSDCQFQKFR